jgi:hypothetical protein
MFFNAFVLLYLALPMHLYLYYYYELYVDGLSMKCDKDNGIEYEWMEVYMAVNKKVKKGRRGEVGGGGRVK